MRKLSLLLLGLCGLCAIGYAQALSVHDDFEGNGTIDTWFGDDCGLDIAFANPVADASNSSATVLKYDDTGESFANVRFDLPFNFDLSEHQTFSFKIYVPSHGLTGNQPNQVSLKLQDGALGEPWSTQSEIIKPISLDQWQTVSFDFDHDPYLNLNPDSPPPTERRDFNRVLIQVNGEDNSDLVVAYLDEVAYDGTIGHGSDPNGPRFDELVWADEFEQDGPLDDTKWFHQTELPLGGSWYNGEIQHYTDRSANSYVADGVMHLVAKKETYTDQGHTKEYTSARLNSKFAFTYGRVEVRAKLPTGVGTWPAIWMLGQNIDEPGAYWLLEGYGDTPWPACGEIDIMEHWGHNQNFVQSATHTPASHGATINHGGQVIPTASSGFHVYELIWTAEKLIFSVDGVAHYTYEPEVRDAATWPFDAPQYLLLNTAIEPTIEPSFTESTMEVDYVRVYQEGTTSVGSARPGQAVRLYPNPVVDQLRLEVGPTDRSELNVYLYDARGRLQRTFVVPVQAGQAQLRDLADLPAGAYVASFWLAGQKQTVKFQKQ